MKLKALLYIVLVQKKRRNKDKVLKRRVNKGVPHIEGYHINYSEQ